MNRALRILLTHLPVAMIVAAALGADYDPAPRKETRLTGHLAPRGDLNGFRANGEWGYTWPHKHIPLSVPGFELAAGPFDFTLPNHGQTMQHWGMATLWKSIRGTRLKLWCQKEYPRQEPGAPITTAMVTEDWGEWSDAEFKAFAVGDVKAAVADSPEENTILLTFKEGNILVRIEASGPDRDSARVAAVAFTEATIAYRRACAATQTQSVLPATRPGTSQPK
jgi:hypothetical protein